MISRAVWRRTLLERTTIVSVNRKADLKSFVPAELIKHLLAHGANVTLKTYSDHFLAR